MAIQKILKDLKFYQSEKIIYAKDKEVEKTMQIAENELKIQCIWEIFLQNQKNILVLKKMREIAVYTDTCNANSKPGQLYRTRPYYFNMACLRHMIKKKDIFIEKL